MKLSPKNIKKLRQLAHHLKPVLIIGKSGLTNAVLNEFEHSIEHHELIKIKINLAESALRNAITEEIINTAGVCIVQKIGHTVTFFRRSQKPKIEFDKPFRS